MNKIKPQDFADFTGCYVAMDKNGDWFVYTDLPQISSSGISWFCSAGDVEAILNGLIDWKGDWKDSLHCPQSEYRYTINNEETLLPIFGKSQENQTIHIEAKEGSVINITIGDKK